MPTPSGEGFNLVRGSVIIGLVGVLLTASLAWGASAINRRTEHRLLQLQTRQAAALIAASVLAIKGPLTTALEVAVASNGSRRQFNQYMGSVTSPKGLFVSASLLQVTGSAATTIASVGASPWLGPTTAAGGTFISQAMQRTTFSVTTLRRGTNERIGYAVATTTNPRFVIYAERAIPPDRQVPVEKDSAFSELNYATYVGPSAPQNLATTDVPPSQLPLSGYTTHAAVPFGDSEITLAATARGRLGGTLGAVLPWIILPTGLLVTAGAVLVVEQLVRRRRRAEQHADTLAAVYAELDELYGQQRTIAEALQQALLPQYQPLIPGLEMASRYVAGVNGVDIGGDWYSVIDLPDGNFGFVVGDVSGRGVGAATVMARIRFTICAYLLEGHSPADVLAMCADQVDIERDGHFATALVGVGVGSTGEVTLANAGHLNPLLIVDGQAGFCATNVGLPLGAGPGPYEMTHITVPPGGTLLGFTDGLVERRGEHLDVGLRRLTAAASASQPVGTLDATLSQLLTEMIETGAEDDVAIIAVRRLAADRDEVSTTGLPGDDHPVGDMAVGASRQCPLHPVAD